MPAPPPGANRNSSQPVYFLGCYCYLTLIDKRMADTRPDPSAEPKEFIVVLRFMQECYGAATQADVDALNTLDGPLGMLAPLEATLRLGVGLELKRRGRDGEEEGPPQISGVKQFTFKTEVFRERAPMPLSFVSTQFSIMEYSALGTDDLGRPLCWESLFGLYSPYSHDGKVKISAVLELPGWEALTSL